MQSLKKEQNSPITPQKSPQAPLIKSNSVNRNEDDSSLLKGNTRHQIFSNNSCIFCVSSTLEYLYRYKFNPDTNEVVEILVFKRVRNGDVAMMRLRNIKPMLLNGTVTPFEEIRYDVYSLISNRHLSGYMLNTRSVYGFDQISASERMYYAFQKYEKKGES